MNALARASSSLLARSPLTHRLVHGMFWSLFGAVISRVITVLGMIFIARYLGKGEYGELAMVQSTVGMVGVFAGFGLGTTATKYAAEMKKNDPLRLGRIISLTNFVALAWGICVALGLVALAPWISERVLGMPELRPLVVLSSLIVLLSAAEGAQAGTLTGLEAFKAMAAWGLIAALIGTAVTIFLTILVGLKGAIAGLAIQGFIQLLVSRYLLRIYCDRFGIGLGLSGMLREWRVLRDFSLPALLCSAVVAPAHWLCHAMLVNSHDGYSEMAVLAVANQWFSMVMFVPMMAGRAALPLLTQHVTEKSHTNVRKLLLLCIGANAAVAVPLAIITSALSPMILKLYGPAYASGSFTLVIGVFTAALLAIQAPVGSMLIAASRVWLGAAMNLAWAIIYITFTYFLLDFGSLGVISAMGVAYVFHSIWTFSFAYFQIKTTT